MRRSCAPTAPAGAPSGRAAPTSRRSPSARSPTRRSARPTHLADFYPDLADPDARRPLRHLPPALLDEHRRRPGSGPSRSACSATTARSTRSHGNVAWMRAREGALGSGHDGLIAPVVDESGSDSAMLDNALELLVRDGRDVRHAVAMLVPEAWQRPGPRRGAARLLPLPRDARRAVGRPGRRSSSRDGARRRRGARPQRPAPAALRGREDDLVACASEAGAIPLPEGATVRRGRLGPGQMLAVDPERGVETNAEIKRRLGARAPLRGVARARAHGGLVRRAGRAAGRRPVRAPRALRLHPRGAER